MLAQAMTARNRELPSRARDAAPEELLLPAVEEAAADDADEPAEAEVGELPPLPLLVVVAAAEESSGHRGRAMTTGATSAKQVEPADETMDSKETDH